MAISIYDASGLMAAVLLWVVVVGCLIKYPHSSSSTDSQLKQIIGGDLLERRIEADKIETDLNRKFQETLTFNEDTREDPETTPDFSESCSGDGKMDSRYIEIVVRSGSVRSVN